MYREDILAHAYARCRANKGAPGVDRQDFADVEAYGVERWLGELALALREETYRPEPIKRVFIPKANGKLRPLGVPTLRDRVCMTAAMLVLEPIYDADLPPEQYAYRPGRSAQQAVVEVEEVLFPQPSGRRGRRPLGLLREHSACRTAEIGGAPSRGSTRARPDQAVAGVSRGRNR
jgi:retron-type reverse transcriptase